MSISATVLSLCPGLQKCRSFCWVGGGPLFKNNANHEVDQIEAVIRMKISLFRILVYENTRVPKDATNGGFNIFPNINFETDSPT